jgi:Holliday junction resolvase RusA-like endonuclease
VTLPLGVDHTPAPVPPASALTVVVYGDPGPQGSKRPQGRFADGRPRMVESSAKVEPWREAVKLAALRARREDAQITWDEAVTARMVFTFVRPRSHYRTGRNAHLLRAAAPPRPIGYPDVSKLARSTEDALTAAAVYRDDARIVDYTRLAKVWAGEDPEALDALGARITISTLGGPT